MMAEKWCQYPPPMVRSVRLKYSQSKMTKLFHRLPLLIPVGDYKPSRLAEHPNLKIIGGPTVNLVQSEGKDLCVSKSLASASML